jgi:hypothetical protein
MLKIIWDWTMRQKANNFFWTLDQKFSLVRDERKD